MDLALLGADEEALALLRFAAAGGSHHLVAAFDVGPLAAAVREINPDVQIGEDWESLLIGSQADLVLVARGPANPIGQAGANSDRRADQFRKLAQAAVPLLVVCPA